MFRCGQLQPDGYGYVCVGMECPSWVGAMMAIENIASDKVVYCASYGIIITEDECQSLYHNKNPW